MIMVNKDKLHQSENGFASIVIALVLIIVLAILTVGFAALTSREQQQALAKQLSTRAYYAAETGINDALKAIKDHHVDSDKTSCDWSSVDYAAYFNPNINSTLGVSYTCLLIQLEEKDLVRSIEPGAGWQTTFTTNNPLSKLQFGWVSGQAAVPGGTNKGFLTVPSWVGANKYPAVIQVDITPLSATNSRSSLLSSTFHAFLYPGTAAGGISYSTSATSQGQVVSGNCNSSTGVGSKSCSVTIDSFSDGTGPYLVHLIDYYTPATITISGTDTSGNPVTFNDGQVTIDSTGRARNVLKRLQERVPLKNFDFPDYAIEGQNICSRMVTAPVNSNNPNGTDFYNAHSPNSSVITNPTINDNGCNPVFD